MAGPSRTLKLTYLGDASQLQKTNKNIGDDLTTTGEKFKKFGKKAAAAFALAGAAAVAMGVKFGKDAIKSASDLSESVNALEVVFGDASKEMLKLSDAAAKTVGLSKTEFNSLAVTFSSFTKQLATDNKSNIEVTDELTRRIADFASVMNLEVADAGAKFQSILAGSSEVSRQFGIDTSAAAVTQYALEAGLIASASEMDESTRIMATYQLLMQETDVMTGDFANTSDGLANSQRILKAEFENVKAEAGQALLPVMETLVAFLAGPGLDALKNFTTGFTKFIDKSKEWWQENGPQVIEAFDKVKEAFTRVAREVGELKDSFSALFGEVEENTGEGSAIFTFANFLEGVAIILDVIGETILRFITPVRQFVDLLERIVNSGIVGVLREMNGLVNSRIGAGLSQVGAVVSEVGGLAKSRLGIAPSFTPPTRPQTNFQGPQGPQRFNPLLPPVQGPNRAGVNINIQGAIDPEGTARQIRRILDDSVRRVGPQQSASFAP